MSTRLALATTGLLLALGVARPLGAEPAKAVEATPLNDAPLPVKGVDDWRARAMKWFTATDEKGQRKEMRKMTRALRQPCRYCHTVDFTGYTEKRLVSQQMMALSAEHGVACKECHAGKNTLTKMGEDSRRMFTLARERQVFCGHCHVPGKRFLELNAAGKAHEAEQKKKGTAP